MLYAQFYHRATVLGRGDPKVVQACGDRSVVILDARTSCEAYRPLVAATAKERGYCGYSLHRGENFSRSTCVQHYTSVE